MIRSVHRRIAKLEKRFVPSEQLPKLLIQFVDANKEVTGTMHWEHGEKKFWYAPGHEPDASLMRRNTPDDRR